MTTVGELPPDRDVAPHLPLSLRIAGGVAWRVVAIAAACYLLIQVVIHTREILIPVAVALLLAALLNPVVSFVNDRTPLSRHGVAALTVICMLLLVFGIMTEAGHQLVAGISGMKEQALSGVDKLQTWLREGPLHLNDDQVSNTFGSAREWVTKNQGNFTSGALKMGSSAAEVVAGTLIALITLFFFLADGARIWRWCMRLLPLRVQDVTHNAFRRGWASLGSYARTQVIVAAVDAVGIAIGAWALDLPFVIPIAVIVFFASFVPVIGAIVSGAIPVLIAIVAKDFTAAIIMLLIVIAVQQLESHVLQPVLMSKAVSIHPLAVILGVALGSFLMGLVGALFAVPILAVINSVVLYMKGYDLMPWLGVAHLTHPPRNRAPLTTSPESAAPDAPLATPGPVGRHSGATEVEAPLADKAPPSE